jgi:hypothetical protein
MNSLPIIIAIAAAAAVVVLVLVAVLVSRRRKARVADKEPAGSFLGSRPQDTFAGLGEPETPAEAADDEFRLDWGHTGDGVAVADARAAPRGEGTPAEEGEPAGPDEGEPSGPNEGEASAAHAGEPSAATGDEVAAGVPAETAAEVADETAAEVAGVADEVAAETEHVGGADAEDATRAPAPEYDSLAEVEAVADVPTAEHAAVVAGEAAPEAPVEPPEAPVEPPSAPPARRMVPLSDIIVTTSRKMVDLDDPEVRRMLTELVRYEIDQASEFSAAGQSVDAILQLTEAEKVSRTLGMDETAARIKTMMRELRD